MMVMTNNITKIKMMVMIRVTKMIKMMVLITLSLQHLGEGLS